MDKNLKITKVEVVDKNDNAQIIMNFKKQELGKKFDKKYFALSNILDMNSKNNITKKDENTNNNTNNNTSTNENTKTKEENQTTNNQNNTNTNESNTNTNNNSNTNTNSNTNENNQTTTNNQEQEKKEKTTAKINDVIYPMYLPENTYLTSQDTIDTKEGSRLILTFGGDSSFVLVEETAGASDEGMIIPVSGEFDFLADVIGVISNKSLSWHSNGIDYYMTSDTLEVSELVEIARSVSVLPVSK